MILEMIQWFLSLSIPPNDMRVIMPTPMAWGKYIRGRSKVIYVLLVMIMVSMVPFGEVTFT